MTARSLWVTNDLPPRKGGIEQFLANLLARLEPDTTRVLASAYAGADAADAGVAYDVRRIGRRPLLPSPAVLRRVRSQIKEFDPEVVVFGAAWPLAELAAHLHVPSVALTHGHEAGIAKVGGGALIRHALRGVSRVGYISEFTRRQLTPWIPPGVAVDHLPPGVDVDAFRPDVDGSGIRRRHGIPEGAPTVVCISRLVRRKGQDVLIEAWPRVRQQHLDARLLLGGRGPLEGRLRRRITELDLGNHVVLTGEVDWGQLPAFHRAADVFAMPCRTRAGGLDVEGLGIVFLEAQASGVPVVVGTSGGAPESCEPDRSGLLVDGRSANDVAGAVMALLRDPDRREEMGAHGRTFVEQRYAWPVIADRFIEMLQQATAAARRL